MKFSTSTFKAGTLRTMTSFRHAHHNFPLTINIRLTGAAELDTLMTRSGSEQSHDASATDSHSDSSPGDLSTDLTVLYNMFLKRCMIWWMHLTKRAYYGHKHMYMLVYKNIMRRRTRTASSCSKHWGNRACKLFNIRLYATLCFNYFRWHRRIFSYGSAFELLIY